MSMRCSISLKVVATVPWMRLRSSPARRVGLQAVAQGLLPVHRHLHGGVAQHPVHLQVRQAGDGVAGAAAGPRRCAGRPRPSRPTMPRVKGGLAAGQDLPQADALLAEGRRPRPSRSRQARAARRSLMCSMSRRPWRDGCSITRMRAVLAALYSFSAARVFSVLPTWVKTVSTSGMGASEGGQVGRGAVGPLQGRARGQLQGQGEVAAGALGHEGQAQCASPASRRHARATSQHRQEGQLVRPGPGPAGRGSGGWRPGTARRRAGRSSGGRSAGALRMWAASMGCSSSAARMETSRRDGHGQGLVPEELAGDPRHVDHREEHGHGGQGGRHHRRGHLLGRRGADRRPPVAARPRRQLQVPVDVLQHHDGVVHEHARRPGRGRPGT